MSAETACTICHQVPYQASQIVGLENEPLLGSDGICNTCRASFALFPPAATRRPLRPCARCGGRELIRCQVRTGDETDVSLKLKPLAASYPRQIVKGFFSDKRKVTNQPAVLSPVGLFEAHVCRGCGYTDWYARDPAAIPIGPEFGTELETAPDEGPYR